MKPRPALRLPLTLVRLGLAGLFALVWSTLVAIAMPVPPTHILHVASLEIPAGTDTLTLDVAAPYAHGATELELWLGEPAHARLAGRMRIEGTAGDTGVFRRQSTAFSPDATGPQRLEVRLPADLPPSNPPPPIAVRAATVSRRGPLHPFLKTDGIFLKNHHGTGDIVRLRGVNLGGWMLQESFMSPIPGGWDEYRLRATLTRRFGASRAEELIATFQDAWITERDFARMAEAGLNCVRLPIYWQNHLHEDGSFKRLPDGSIDFSRIDRAVRDAKRHGLYTILDLHGAPGSQNGRDHAGDQRGPLLWESPHYRAMTKSLWRELARRYRDEPAVAGYDLLNEPARTSKAKQWDQLIIDFMGELYAEVRAVDPAHVVFFSVWSEYPHIGNLTEGKTNYVLAYHWYIYRRFLDEGGTEADFWHERVTRHARISRDTYDAPVFIGEFSFKDGPAAWGDRLEFMTRHGLGWAKWAYKTRAAGLWGLYEARHANDHNIPDPEKDDFATIRRKWASWRTEDTFTPDPAVIAALRRAAALHPPGPVTFPPP
ncbi:MAG: glycoside hydrolase family 5 protein [Opitutaceae bacterium]|nr:glycoside hydrolase family 5 protein [Opitutaceae bacterium]